MGMHRETPHGDSANGSALGQTAGKSAAAFAPFDHRPCGEKNLTFTYMQQTFATAGLAWDEFDQDGLHLHDAQGAFTGAALLLSDQNPFAVKCAVFAGDTKTQLKDRVEIRGSALRQINDAAHFLTLHNIDGQWPEAALHESLVNAVLHRDYEYSGPILVNVFSNRIEIVSLGGLVRGLQINDLLNGICQPRNAWLVPISTALGIGENYGTGIPRIMDAYATSSASPQLRVGPSSVAMVLPVPVLDDESWNEENEGHDGGDDDEHQRTEPAAKRYAFPELRPYITQDHAQALVGARVIGVAPLSTLVLGTGATPEEQPLEPPHSYVVQMLEEVTLHLMASNGVALVRKDLEMQLGLSRNQAAYLLRSLTRQGKIRRVGHSRATRYYLS
ncbi:MAG: transcriptional regulator [Bifidobacterium subtile]|jgi:ATP-dependent DNA helicase RecG|uniref:ATP-binding protein n=1 Tax=Bifidobacterium subtile TaxID=77635 RepID=UPI002F3609F7|nr:transcriptional regulator [Bifidobacterium subtile]MCI1240588.1 transcriptional regulator [Bifidobacterium subtile]MCI1258028.1 transcriptional regulator [Bifidobacterium subtile]